VHGPSWRAWSPEGIEVVCRWFDRIGPALPEALRQQVADAIEAARATAAAAPQQDAAAGAWRRRCFEASRALERLQYVVECCELPDRAWVRPDRIGLCLRRHWPIRIRATIRWTLVTRLVGREQALGTRTERRCDWLWRRCAGDAPEEPEATPVVPRDVWHDVHELVHMGDDEVP